MDLISSPTYWALKNNHPSAIAPLRQDARCEVLIVGGGISGSLIANELVAAGMDVILIDRGELAHGSTSASTALLQYESDLTIHEMSKKHGAKTAEDLYTLSYKMIDKIEQIALSNGHHSFTKKKSFYFAMSTEDVTHLEKEYEIRTRLGFDVEFVNQDKIENLFSFSRQAALLSYQAAQIDPYLFTEQIILNNQKQGMRVYNQSTLKDFRSDHDGVECILENDAIIQAKYLVLATGYETAQYIPRDLYELHSSYTIVSEPVASFTGWYDKSLIWDMERPYLYLRTDDQRAIIGGLDEPFFDPKKRDVLLKQKIQTLETAFAKLFPKIPFKLAYSWAATFAESKDGLPIVGLLPNEERCFACCGFGGNGITYSALAAEIIRATIENKTHPLTRALSFDHRTANKNRESSAAELSL